MSIEQKPGTQKITKLFKSKISDPNQPQKRPGSALISPDKVQETKKPNVQIENECATKISSKCKE